MRARGPERPDAHGAASSEQNQQAEVPSPITDTFGGSGGYEIVGGMTQPTSVSIPNPVHTGGAEVCPVPGGHGLALAADALSLQSSSWAASHPLFLQEVSPRDPSQLGQGSAQSSLPVTLHPVGLWSSLRTAAAASIRVCLPASSLPPPPARSCHQGGDLVGLAHAAPPGCSPVPSRRSVDVC